MKFYPDDAITFDDVLIRPGYSKLSSRLDIDYTVDAFGLKRLSPVMVANMIDIATPAMWKALAPLRIIVPFNRINRTLEERVAEVKYAATLKKEYDMPVAAVVGLNDREEIEKLTPYVDILFLDVAYAYTEAIIDEITWLKRTYGHYLVVGNVATREAAIDLASLKVDFVKCGVGPGCFAAGTRILMANAEYKNIEHVQKGDKIITGSGKVATVKSSFCTGIKKTLTVRHSIFNKKLQSTLAHNFLVGDLNNVAKKTLSSRGYKWCVERKDKKVGFPSKIRWKEIAKTEQDVLLAPKNIEFDLPETFSIALPKKSGGNWRSGTKFSTDIKLLPSYDLGYIFGFFLGDGTAHCSAHPRKNGGKNSTGSVHFYPALKEERYIDKLNRCIKNAIKNDLDLSVKLSAKKTSYICSLYYKPLAGLLHTFGKKQDKHLPTGLLVNNKNYIKGLLDGLVDSDGHIEKNTLRTGVRNTSPRVIEVFGILCYLVHKHFPNVEPLKPTIGNLEGAKLENVHKSWQARPLLNPTVRETKDYKIVKILEKEKNMIAVPVYDLEIDSEEHSFIANNVIVHNSVCSTRVVTGCGVSQLSAIIECSREADIIADGGIRSSSDATKALAAGASFVMCGGLFAGTDEALDDGTGTKIYRGLASASANANKRGIIPEGISTHVPNKGPAEKVAKNFLAGIRQGMGLVGAANLFELREKAVFQRVSHATTIENTPHIKI